MPPESLPAMVAEVLEAKHIAGAALHYAKVIQSTRAVTESYAEPPSDIPAT